MRLDLTSPAAGLIIAAPMIALIVSVSRLPIEFPKKALCGGDLRMTADICAPPHGQHIGWPFAHLRALDRHGR